MKRYFEGRYQQRLKDLEEELEEKAKLMLCADTYEEGIDYLKEFDRIWKNFLFNTACHIKTLKVDANYIHMVKVPYILDSFKEDSLAKKILSKIAVL